jgi:Fe-S cluster assembly ATP-binding protein
MLQIKNLHVEIEGKEILKGLNLSLNSGEVHALMGPNGSGKSTLANVLIGNPKYKITKGEILFDEENILSLNPEERAKKGIFLSFQNPVSIPGVNIRKFLRQAYNSLNPENKISLLEFQEILEKKSEELNLDKSFLERYLNEGFSGGEKKKLEILQLLVLNPSFAILDETDSGLDIDALKIIARGINAFTKSGENKTVLIITHYKRILEHIRPDKVSIMIRGEITASGGIDLVDHLEEKGYGWIEGD